MSSVAVAGDDERARACARELNLPLLSVPSERHEATLVLRWENGVPCLALTGPDAPGPVHLNWLDPAVRRRVQGGRRQPLARAAGLHHGSDGRILDATGGMGRDGFVLAALGARVTLCERNPVLYFLLDDARRRATADGSINPWIARLRLFRGDARECLATTQPSFDVVYLDPMYPTRNKQALARKEMRVLRALVGDDGDSSSLFAAAMAHAGRRVVVKRPAKAPPLAARAPSFSYRGKQARYDVYLTPGQDS